MRRVRAGSSRILDGKSWPIDAQSDFGAGAKCAIPKQWYWYIVECECDTERRESAFS